MSLKCILQGQDSKNLVTKSELEQVKDDYLPKSGGKMVGTIEYDTTGNEYLAMRYNKVGFFLGKTGILRIAHIQDGVRDTMSPSLLITNGNMILDGSTNEHSTFMINNLVDPMDDQDAATKYYVDNTIKYHTNPNLLDNWYFINPVNQRGQTEYTGNATYSIDRWWTQYDTTLSIVDGGIKIGGKWDVQQYFETTLPNVTYTLSLLYKDRTGSDPLRLLAGNRTDGDLAQTESKDASGILSVTFSTAKLNKVNFGFTGSTDNSAIIIAIKLELGDTQTLAHKEGDKWVLNEIPDYGEQLSRCQRYFVRLGGQTNCPLGTLVVREPSKADVFVKLPVTMRTNPTLVSSVGEFFTIPYFQHCTITGMDVADFNLCALWCDPINSETFTENRVYHLNCMETAHIDLSADL